MFCNYSHKYNPFLVFYKVAFTINKSYSKSTIMPIVVPKKCKDVGT